MNLMHIALWSALGLVAGAGVGTLASVFVSAFTPDDGRRRLGSLIGGTMLFTAAVFGMLDAVVQLLV